MKKLVKIIGYCLGFLVGIIFLVLVGFRLWAVVRETGDRHALAPKEGTFVQAGDVELFVHDVGPKEGTAVVFTHGTGGWSKAWVETLEVLSEEGFRGIAIDMPPFGFSERPQDSTFSRQKQAERIWGMLDTLGIEKTVLVGHSVGGGAVVEAAMMRPERVERLVLVDVALGLQDPRGNENSWQARLLRVGFLRDAVVATTGTNPWLTRYWLGEFIYDPEDISLEMVRMFQEPLYLQNSTETLGVWLIDLLFPDNSAMSRQLDNYRQLKMPVDVLWGDKDTVTPLRQGEYLTDLIPESEMQVLVGVGHMPQLEEPELFNDLLVEVLEGGH